MPTRHKPGLADLAVLLTIIVGGAFSFYLAGSRLLVCGRDLAGSEIYYWLSLSGIQSALFLAAALHDGARKAYRWSQYLTLPIVVLVAGQLALAYPRAFVCAGLLAAVYWLSVAIRRGLGNRNGERAALPAIGAAVLETVVFLLATAIIHSVLAFLVLHMPGTTLDDGKFIAIAAVSPVTAGFIIRRGVAFAPFSIAAIPPMGLLILVLLRAKFPDLAYDSLFYKATLPILIADWRTAITGILDHSLVGTDLFEIINAQARIADPGYSPALTSTFAFLALWMFVPMAARSILPRSPQTAHALAANACALMIVSLTEPLVAAGTAYHEPMLAVLLTASLLPMAVAWLFLGAAIAGKFTVVFIVPLILLVKANALALSADPVASRLSPYGSSWFARVRHPATVVLRLFLQGARARPAVTALCVSLAVLAVGEQFYRNLAYTGRLLGVSEILGSLTDPGGNVLARQGADSVFDVVAQRGIREKYAKTLVHVMTLDRWIVPDELGFHVMPTSRLIGVATGLALLVIVLPALRRNAPLLVLFMTWVVCAVAMMNFFSQGRHLFPLSFGAAIVIAYLVGERVRDAQPTGTSLTAWAFCAAVVAAAIGDQVVGSFINDGWDCRRSIAARVEPSNYDRPESPIERRLADIARQYRAKHAQFEAAAPSIACESPTERMHYLGMHYVYAQASLVLTQRLLTARPGNAELLPTSLLAICFANEAFFEQIVPAEQRKHYVETEGVKGIRIMVSKPLMAGAAPTSLFNTSQGSLDGLFRKPPIMDFVAAWEQGRLNDYTPIQTPNGKGALVMDAGGRKVGVLLSPYSVTFDNVKLRSGDRLKLDMAMPYSNSDGMGIEIVLENRKAIRRSFQFSVPPKPATAADPVWEGKEITIPPEFDGAGTLSIVASSPSGDPVADWVYFRRMEIVPAER